MHGRDEVSGSWSGACFAGYTGAATANVVWPTKTSMANERAKTVPGARKVPSRRPSELIYEPEKPHLYSARDPLQNIMNCDPYTLHSTFIYQIKCRILRIVQGLTTYTNMRQAAPLRQVALITMRLQMQRPAATLEPAKSHNPASVSSASEYLRPSGNRCRPPARHPRPEGLARVCPDAAASQTAG